MASKSHKGNTDRAERVRQMQREQQRKERRRAQLIYGITGVVVLLMIGGVTFSLVRTAQRNSLAAVKSYKVTPQHVSTPVKYAQTPPAGGKHNPIWLNCATYAKAIPNENAAHSMEHGAIWVTYRPGLSAGQMQVLQSAMPPTYAILSPYPGLKSPVVASAWGKQISLKGANDPRLKAFIRKYTQGPQAPESGAACTGGTDGTLPLNAGGGMSDVPPTPHTEPETP